jgi:hypothetical protein
MKLWKALMVMVLAVGITAKKIEGSYGEEEIEEGSH